MSGATVEAESEKSSRTDTFCMSGLPVVKHQAPASSTAGGRLQRLYAPDIGQLVIAHVGTKGKVPGALALQCAHAQIRLLQGQV